MFFFQRSIERKKKPTTIKGQHLEEGQGSRHNKLEDAMIVIDIRACSAHEGKSHDHCLQQE